MDTKCKIMLYGQNKQNIAFSMLNNIFELKRLDIWLEI